MMTIIIVANTSGDRGQVHITLQASACTATIASPAAVAVHITCMTRCPEVKDRIASQHTLQEGYANKVFVCL